MPADPVTPGAVRRLRAPDIDIGGTLRPLGVYGIDPTFRREGRSFAKAVLTPEGPGSMRLEWDDRGEVTATAWGPGATWLLDGASRWIGLHDDLDGFDPSLHPKVAQWWRRHGTVRLGAIGVIWQELVLVILGQRVTTEEAARSWARLCRTWGEPAPGPDGLTLPPTPERVAALGYVELHRINVERRRADAILLAARRAARLEEAATMPPAEALARLSALPGLGVWTATATMLASHGDPDTVVMRDYGMPTLVNFAFTGDGRRLDPDRGGDEVMCAHLAPWSGHRQRIVRLVMDAGVSPPRRGPRSVNPDIRRL